MDLSTVGAIGKTKWGKGCKIMAITDANGLPIALCTGSATPHEVTLVEHTLHWLSIEELPEKLIGDKAYDSDGLDKTLSDRYGVEMIAPNRSNRKKSGKQDVRKLRCYKRRWKVECLFAWIQNFRRYLTRYEYHLANFAGFRKLARVIILLRQF